MYENDKEGRSLEHGWGELYDLCLLKYCFGGKLEQRENQNPVLVLQGPHLGTRRSRSDLLLCQNLSVLHR